MSNNLFYFRSCTTYLSFGKIAQSTAFVTSFTIGPLRQPMGGGKWPSSDLRQGEPPYIIHSPVSRIGFYPLFFFISLSLLITSVRLRSNSLEWYIYIIMLSLRVKNGFALDL